MKTNDYINVKEVGNSGRAYMLKKLKLIEIATSVIADLLCSEIKDEQDKIRVQSYRRGLEKSLHIMRYS